jgi:hypothetical protein
MAREKVKELRKEKLSLEQQLDQECEAVVNKLVREKSLLENDNQALQAQLQVCLLPAHPCHVQPACCTGSLCFSW